MEINFSSLLFSFVSGEFQKSRFASIVRFARVIFQIPLFRASHGTKGSKGVASFLGENYIVDKEGKFKDDIFMTGRPLL